MIKRTLSILLAVCMLCCLCACARRPPANDALAPKRVVAANRSMADLWLLAGGELAGATEDAMELEGVDGETKVIGTTEKLNLEAIVALEPELVLLSATIPAHKTARNTLEEMQIPCMSLEIDSFDDYDSAMQTLTAMTGREDLYKTNVQDVRARIDEILKKSDGTQASFLAIRISPSKTVALKNDYFSCDIISSFGLQNVAQDDTARGSSIRTPTSTSPPGTACRRHRMIGFTCSRRSCSSLNQTPDGTKPMPTSTVSSGNRKLYLIAPALLLAGLALSLFGPGGELTPARLFGAMLRPGSGSPESLIFWSLRVPRTLAVLLCGGALSAAGLLLQRTLHNDLASPGILGINAGAGFFALLAGLLLPGALLARGLFAFAGAMGAVGIVLLLSRRIGSSKSSILLLGIAVSTMMTALSNGIVTAFPEAVPDKVAFSLGGFHAISARQIVFSVCAVIPALALCFFLHRGIGMLALGDEACFGLGLDPKKMRAVTLVCASVLAAAAVSICGLLGSMGLIVPNCVRLMGARTVRSQLGLSIVYGGGFLLLCDSLIRLLFYPFELPVGLLLSALGAPFFIFLLARRRRRAAE